MNVKWSCVHVGSGSSFFILFAEEYAEVLRVMPPALKEGVFDVFLLYCEEDARMALKFLSFLESALKLKVCVTNEERNIAHKRNQFDKIEDAIARSLYTFIFVTTNLNEDTWAKYMGNLALAESIESNAEFVVPVRAENCRVPFSLQPLTPLRIYHIMEELPDHPEYSVDSDESVGSSQSGSSGYSSSNSSSRQNSRFRGQPKQAPFVERQILRLLSARETLKVEREREDKVKRDNWIRVASLEKYRERKFREKEEAMRDQEYELQLRRIDQEAELHRPNLERLHNERANAPLDIRPAGPMRSDDVYHRTQAPFNPVSPYGQPRATQFGPPGHMPGLYDPLHVHYVFPSVHNASDLAPRATYNINPGQIANLQVGNNNQMVETQPEAPFPQAAFSSAELETMPESGDRRTHDWRPRETAENRSQNYVPMSR